MVLRNGEGGGDRKGDRNPTWQKVHLAFDLAIKLKKNSVLLVRFHVKKFDVRATTTKPMVRNVSSSALL